MKTPIILWPKITPDEVWDDCHKWVDDHGGLSDENPSQGMAAAGADPGVCSCPNCHEMHWQYGKIHKCPTCNFIYPTDWWPMFAYGCSFGRRGYNGFEAIFQRRIAHPYFKYGYENPVDDAWAEHDKIPWKTIIGDCFIYGGEFSQATDFKSQIEGSTAPCGEGNEFPALTQAT